MNNEREYELSLRKVSYTYTTDNGFFISDALEYLNECICNLFNKNNLKTLIIQTPLNFMDVFRPCCIMIRKNKDNEKVQIKAVSNNIQTFPFDRKHVTTHPIETMLKEFNMFKYIQGNVYESECDPYCDMYAEILRILRSEYYDNIPEHHIDSPQQPYVRIIYESKEYEDVHINAPWLFGVNTDKENNPFGVSTLLSSVNTSEEDRTMNQVTEDSNIMLEDINDGKYMIFVTKDCICQQYPLFIRAEDKRKIFNYKCLRELITDANDVLIEFSIGSLSDVTCRYKPCDINIAPSSIHCDKIAKSDSLKRDIIQNSICLNLNDYNKFKHIFITINK